MITVSHKYSPVENKFWTFPGGERSVKLTTNVTTTSKEAFVVKMDFRGSDDLVDMIMAVNALRHEYGPNREIELLVPYFPFSRQDRVMTTGESFGLQAAVDMIKLCNFSKVTTWDIHSDVAGAMFPPGVFVNVSQDKLWADRIRDLAVNESTVIISPDAGALKKIYKVAAATGLPVVEAKKVRDVATGHITSTEIDGSRLIGVGNAIIVDDICDGGRTFIELAKAIRASGYCCNLTLCVTHGIFSKGLDVFAEDFDEVYTVNNIGGVDLDTFNNSTK